MKLILSALALSLSLNSFAQTTNSTAEFHACILEATELYVNGEPVSNPLSEYAQVLKSQLTTATDEAREVADKKYAAYVTKVLDIAATACEGLHFIR